MIAACKVAGFDLIIVETSGIGQGDAAIVPLVDVSLYVMTPEFGAASQLEKIDMLDFADFVAINKFDRKGAPDALRDVRKQFQRNRERCKDAPEAMPVFGTMASRFNDDGVTALYQAIAAALAEKGLKLAPGKLPAVTTQQSTAQNAIVPAARVRYLAEIAESARDYRKLGRSAGEASRASGSSCVRRGRCSPRPSPAPLPPAGRGETHCSRRAVSTRRARGTRRRVVLRCASAEGRRRHVASLAQVAEGSTAPRRPPLARAPEVRWPPRAQRFDPSPRTCGRGSG